MVKVGLAIKVREMGKLSPAVSVIAAVVVLLGAYAVGLGIKAVRSSRQAEPKVESKQQSRQIDTEAAPRSAKPEGAQMVVVEEEYAIVEEPVEELAVEPEEISKEEPVNMPEEEPVEELAAKPEEKPEEERVDMAEAEPVESEPQEAESFGGWRQVWADLNLTEEEQARLREGFRLALERWQNMSDEERQAETDRLRRMGERWQNMSDEERREATQRMRDRFEEWRQSGRVELPELSLD